jgi:hypothetical protein
MEGSFDLRCLSGLAVAVLALPACFDPVYAGLLCGPGDSCPRGYSCIASAMTTCEVACDPSTQWGEVTAVPGEVNMGENMGQNDDPSWTANRLTIVFASTRNGVAKLFEGTRPSTTDGFQVRAIGELNDFALGDVSSPEISADGTKIYFAANPESNKAGSSRDVFMSQRNADGGWGGPVLVAALSDPMVDESDVAVSPDGETAMIARAKTLMIAFRASPDATFGQPTAQTSLTVPGVSGGNDVAAPSITNRAETVYFHAGATRDLYYYATPTDAGFAQPMPITELNDTPRRDSAPFVSADGCYLLFARNYQIYQASRRPGPAHNL